MSSKSTSSQDSFVMVVSIPTLEVRKRAFVDGAIARLRLEELANNVLLFLANEMRFCQLKMMNLATRGRLTTNNDENPLVQNFVYSVMGRKKITSLQEAFLEAWSRRAYSLLVQSIGVEAKRILRSRN